MSLRVERIQDAAPGGGGWEGYPGDGEIARILERCLLDCRVSFPPVFPFSSPLAADLPAGRSAAGRDRSSNIFIISRAAIPRRSYRRERGEVEATWIRPTVTLAARCAQIDCA